VVSSPAVDGRPPTGSGGAPPTPGSRRTLIVVVVVAALLVAATIVAVVVDTLRPDRDADGDVAWTVQVPRDGRSEAQLEVVDGATDVRVAAGDLGDQLLRVETPSGGALVPQVTEVDGAVRVALTETGNDGAGVVEIVVHREVLWSVRVLGGAAGQRIDLTEARVSHVDLAGGASTMDLLLPAPAGTVEIRMSGGVSTWRIGRPEQIPVQVRLGSGAGSVTLDDQRRDGIAGGESVASDGWADATDRYDIDAVAGVSDLTVTSN
jgi:hypothetical protein